MIIKNKKSIILFALIFMTAIILTSCGVRHKNVIDLSGKSDIDLKIHYKGIDELGNYTDLYFEYDGIKTEVFESMKLNENCLPVVIKKDIDLDGKYELIIYSPEKTNFYYKEKICFLDYETGTELSLNQINEKLDEFELEIITLLVNDVFENENFVLSYLKRKQQTIQADSEGNKAFRIVEDISKENSDIKVEICEDEIIKNINYIDNENLPTVLQNVREGLINNSITESIKITKNAKGLIIYTKGSYLIEYKDVNKDNVEDIIFICDVKENEILDENVYYLNGLDLERQNIYVMWLFKRPDDYPLNLIRLNTHTTKADGDPFIMAIRNNEVFYLNSDIYGRDIGCGVADFNGDGENEIVIYNPPNATFGRERFVFAYKEKDFEKISFSTHSIYDIFESVFEYSVERPENEQACYATIKDRNDNQVVIKMSSDTVKPDFRFAYSEFLVSGFNIENKTVSEAISLVLFDRENPLKSRTLSILGFEVIYEMQNDEFVVKDIKYTFKLDFSVVYGFDHCKFEVLENNIEDVK